MNLQYNLKEPDNSHMKRPKNMLRSFVHVEIFNLIAKLCRTRDTDTRRFSLLPCDFVKYFIVLFGIQFFSSLIRLVWTSSIYHTCVRIAHTLICCSIKRRHCNDSHNSSNTPIRALYIKECEREMVTTCHRSHHHIQSSLKIICAACACFSLFLSLSLSCTTLWDEHACLNLEYKTMTKKVLRTHKNTTQDSNEFSIPWCTKTHISRWFKKKCSSKTVYEMNIHRWVEQV